MSHTIKQKFEALKIVLDWAAEDFPTTTEADLVHGVVEHFGNDGALWGPLLFDDPILGSRGFKPKKMFVEDERMKALRSWFRECLTEIVNDRISGPNLSRAAKGRLRVVQVGKHYQAESPEAIICVVLNLLFDKSKGYGADLRACQLEGCPRFFFVSTRPREEGKRRVGTLPKYCSPEHMVKAHNKVKSEWTKAARLKAKQRALALSNKAKRRR
jgi:hypothetical protein